MIATRSIPESVFVQTVIVGPDRRIIFYPCASGDLMNILAILPRDEVDRDSGRSLKEKVLGAYPEFGTAVHRMLEKTEEHRITVYDMEALPGWTKGSVALLGDAAHPFTPFFAQGALQTIKDAASLAVMLPRGISREEVPSRLKLYEQCRKPRAEQIQEFSRIRGRDASGMHGPPPTGADLQRLAIYCVAHDE